MEIRRNDELPGAVGIHNLLADYSLEITPKDLSALQAAKRDLRPGTAVSVTFLAGDDVGSRLAAARGVRQLGLEPVPHLAARRMRSAYELEDYLARLSEEAQIDHVFVIAGDTDRPAGPFNDALSIIRSGLLEKYGVRTVGIAGYPEGHPNILDEALWRALIDKHHALLDHGLSCEITTQFGFDADPFVDWLEELRRRGLEVPVHLGIAGPAGVKTLLRFATRCGVGASAKVVAKYGLSITRLLSKVGPDSIVDELTERIEPVVHGQVRLHLYPFGGLHEAVEWTKIFSSREKSRGIL
ncbi:methylenetetrahydrofolate reductase (plasmid) [Agrobacterium fabrum]|uniref:methylenetetrahydrofolate reductase n=1 Tax=Agrobacterium fabrum TaxID=1176649 RepID=UPI0021D1584E|nr:methylenetetrahydrofolate reductase [Agrobacterium fabrum]UXT61165.1 methylenetetrahydrofolate reductase [Agrobacterium fabrum]